jgi:hypothetical protein
MEPPASRYENCEIPVDPKWIVGEHGALFYVKFVHKNKGQGGTTEHLVLEASQKL